MKKACCFVGYAEILDDKLDKVRRELEQEVGLALSDGYRMLYTRYAGKVEMLIARCILEKREQYPDIFLEAILPTPAHAEAFTRDEWDLLSKSEGLKVLCDSCRKDYALKITRYMIERSERVIAIGGEQADHDTLYAMDYARTMERDLRIIEI